MAEKTLIIYWTKTGINSEAAHTIAEVLETNYKMDVTVADLRDGQPDITPFKNIIVGGGVDNNSVYGEAVDFLGKDFEDKNVALYFSCEDWGTPKEIDTEENSRKVLAKNMSLKPINVAGFGGCVIKQGQPVMDTPNVNKVKDWANELGKKLKALEPMPVVEVMPETEMPTTSNEKAGFFEVHCDAGEKWRFHLKAANGEIIAVSQAYGSKEAAMKGIVSVKRNAPLAEVKDLTAATT